MKSFLDHLGSILRTILHIGETLATVAEPEIALAFPQILPIYSTALGLAVSAQATAATVTGSGPQKLADLTSKLLPQVQAWATENGIVWPEADITKWASALVDTMNLIPAPTVAAPAVTQ